MIDRILTSGQTAPERAAIEVARLLDIECDNGGSERENAVMAEGTLVISEGRPAAPFPDLLNFIRSQGRHCLHVDMMTTTAFAAARAIAAWIQDERVRTLHVTGPDAGPEFPLTVSDVLQTALRLVHVDTAMPGALALFHDDARGRALTVTVPQTVHQAAEILLSRLDFQDRSRIANMSDRKLAGMADSMKRYMMSEFRLGVGNDALLDSCRRALGEPEKGQAPEWAILAELRRKLRSTNVLKVVK